MRSETPLQSLALAVLAALCAPSRAAPLPRPHGGGWVPSGSWSSPASFGAVQHVSVNPWPSTGWSDYSVDPWASQKARYKADPAAWWASAVGRQAAAHPAAPATSVAWYQQRLGQHRQPPPSLYQKHYQQQQHHHHQQQHHQQHQQQQYHHAYQPPLQLYQQPLPPADGYAAYHMLPQQLVYEVPQVVHKKPSYASLYPWAQKAVYQQPLHHHHHGHHHHSEYAGWAKIPVVDHEAHGQWVAWVPEEFEDFVIVRKEKKKKVEIEEEEEVEPEPPKPKKKKVKTTIEEEEATNPEEPAKKKTTIVEEEKTEPKMKKVTETKVEEGQTPSVKTSSVMKTETVQAASTVAQPVSVPAPTPADAAAAATTAS